MNGVMWISDNVHPRTRLVGLHLQTTGLGCSRWSVGFGLIYFTIYQPFFIDRVHFKHRLEAGGLTEVPEGLRLRRSVPPAAVRSVRSTVKCTP